MHIGIIPDGNRRWCKLNHIDYTTKHITEIWLKIFKTYLYDHFKNERLRLVGNLSLEETEKAIHNIDMIPYFDIKENADSQTKLDFLFGTEDEKEEALLKSEKKEEETTKITFKAPNGSTVEFTELSEEEIKELKDGGYIQQ